MPFYFRKSVSFGPVRVNFSRSGVGISAGVKGLRFGAGPRGHYVQAGVGGIYYRHNLGTGRAQRTTAAPRAVSRQRPSLPVYEETGVNMVEIESSEVDGISDEPFAAIAADIERRRRRVRFALVLPLVCLAVAVAGGFVGLSFLAGIGVFLSLPMWLVGYWIDSSRRSSVVAYDLDDELSNRYADLCEAFDELRTSSRKWHLNAAGAIRDVHTSKRNAGAQTLVDLRPTVLAYRQPKVFKSNITPPSLRVGRQTLYLFPDVVLIEDGTRCGGAHYRNIDIVAQVVNHIEADRVPKDAVIVGTTWQYPNKSGGPDRRFRNNAKLPICRYERLSFSSDTGISEALQFSLVGPAAALVERAWQMRV